MPGNLVWFFLSSTWFGSSAIKTPTFSTLSPKNVRSNSVYIFIGICPSLAAVSLNKEWVSAFSPVAGLIFGSICWSKYNCQSSVTSLPESNRDGIWIPWELMHTLEHLATACCIISIFVLAKMEVFLNCMIKAIFLIIMMRTTHILSFGLVCDQRRSQFSIFFGSQSGCLFLKAQPSVQFHTILLQVASIFAILAGKLWI